MTAPAQSTLLDYTPSQGEEVARLTKLAEQRNAQIDALLSDPVFAQAEANARLIDKKIKEMEKIRNDLTKITHQLTEVNLVQVDEPSENGLYILAKAERGYRRGGSIKIRRTLLLKAMGEWFDLIDGGNSLPNYNGKVITFAEFLDIDGGTIGVTLTKLEDESRYPHELLKDTDEAVDVGIEDDDEGY